MLISGANASQSTVAPSAAMTEDGQSVRQLNLNFTGNGTTSDAQTASFRYAGTTERGPASLQRRGNLVLFVKSSDNESDGQQRPINNASLQSQQNGSGGKGSNSDNSQTDTEEGEEEEQENLLSHVISTVSNSGSSVLNSVIGAARKPLLTVAIVLLYFLLLDIVMLVSNERLNRVLRRVRAADNDALVLLSSSLVRQLRGAKKDLYDTVAQSNPPETLERLEMIQHRVLALQRVCNRSIARLHAKLAFPGSAEDLAFLIEEHVAYDAQLQHLATKELEWLHTIMSSSVVHLSDEVPEGQRFVFGSHAAAYGATAGSTGGGSEGKEKLEREGAMEAGAQSNPLRNVRLERVQEPAGGSGAANRVSAQPRSRLARAASAAKQQKAHGNGEGTQDEAAEGVVGGILLLLKNRCIAFGIICLLLAAVLRMG
ncbi:hypothetical protein ABL78_3229 [Leptomonas seymouri]|uniref:Uncharacterized protein n=1 Tax=Leptomonas seymouri TaxID=5684 RepID=A0A0N1PCL1_LEPSE|nr:hypothetical protein ABL78_3229 [Leptomonas seymouri]|eukprot:KPI87691.1 hypothetical protein ABL78_3229 [Leptomonas seymouri]